MIIERMSERNATVYITAEEADVLHIRRDAEGDMTIAGEDYAAALILDAMQRKLGYSGFEYSIGRMSLAARARLAAAGMRAHDIVYRMDVTDACGMRPHRKRIAGRTPEITRESMSRYLRCLLAEDTAGSLTAASAEQDIAVL